MPKVALGTDNLNLFIRYSPDALVFADQLYVTLEVAGFEPKLDLYTIRGAENWQEKLSTLIREVDSVLVLSPSKASFGFSAWAVLGTLILSVRVNFSR